MAVENLEDALIDELKDLLHAEKQILKALPKMAKTAENEELAAAFEEHLEQTRGQVERLEQAFELLGKPARAKTCDGMKGIIEEGSKQIKENDSGPTLDAIMIGAAQKVEHYEIASYGTAVAWAQQLGLNDVAELLEETLQEEKDTDEKLTQISQQINPVAEEGEESEAREGAMAR